MLLVANLLFLLAMGLHALDHTLRGTGDLTTEVMAGGTGLALVALVSLVLTLRRHPWAAPAAALVGLWTVVGVSASHLAPHWSAFSDPYADLGLGLWSWAAMLSELVAALAFAVVGLWALRRGRGVPAAA